MTKIAVILCYFGKLPENFSLFAESCRRNATIDFFAVYGRHTNPPAGEYAPAPHHLCGAATPCGRVL